MQSTSPRRSLTLAIGIALLSGIATMAPVSSSAHTLVDTTAPVAPLTSGPLVLFGGEGVQHHLRLLASTGQPVLASRLDTDGLEELTDPSSLAIAVVAASEIDGLGLQSSRLSGMFHAGVPVFVCMDSTDRRAVARFFGAVPPKGGDVIFVRAPDGRIDVIEADIEDTHWTPSWSKETVDSLTALRSRTGLAAAGSYGETSGGYVPLVEFHNDVMNLVSKELTGKAVITVARNASASSDTKDIFVHASPTFKAGREYEVLNSKGQKVNVYVNAGIYEGHNLPGVKTNLTAALLPWAYRVSHTVSAEGEKVAMTSHLPKTHSETEFDYKESFSRSFNIGGTTGESLSTDGLADAVLAAKLPFNLSVGYSDSTGYEHNFRFKDYSLLAAEEDAGKRMEWKAVIQPTLHNILVERDAAYSPGLTEKRMTPMMRVASFDTTSTWSVNGKYEGSVTVEVDAGFTLNERTWWWDGSTPRRDDKVSQYDRTVHSMLVDLSNPHLTMEPTVRLQSKEGLGGCVTQREGRVSIEVCDSASRNQMWSLNGNGEEGHYVNLGNKQCLSIDIATWALRTATCASTRNQLWKWHADRIHSAYEEGAGNKGHRLYVEGDGSLKVRVQAADDRFQQVDVNPYNKVLNPWAQYPNAPTAGTVIPKPFGQGGNDSYVTEEMARRLRAVPTRERWSLTLVSERSPVQ